MEFSNEIDGQPSQQLCTIDVDNNTASCSPINPIFLPFLSNEPVYILHFKLYDENGNELIPKNFHLMLYNKQMSVYEAEKIYPDISVSSAPPLDDESNTFRLKNITEIESFLNKEIIERDRLCKKFN